VGGHFQTRNRGTLGGSVAHADPSAEIPLCLVALDGTVVVRAKRRERRIHARDFFVGALTTARRPDELLVALEWPIAPPDAGHAFEEIAQRHGDFALAAAACQVRLDDSNRLASVLLALGGVENRLFAVNAGAYHGHPATRETAKEIAEFATSAITPIEDLAADAEYRIALSRVLVERVISRAIVDAQARRGGVQ
jgi:2-furoyl-CoA dehydrogenase FAD binding subunit